MSAAIAGGGYGVAGALDQPRSMRWIIGGSLGLGAGLAKELFDLAGGGDPSVKDLAWDCLGVASGLVIAYAIDRLLDDDPSPPREVEGEAAVELHLRQPFERIAWHRELRADR